jgi:hypothetical protein
MTVIETLHNLNKIGRCLAAFRGDEEDIDNWSSRDVLNNPKDTLLKLDESLKSLESSSCTFVTIAKYHKKIILKKITELNDTTLNVEIARFIKSPYFGVVYEKDFNSLCDRYLDVIENLSVIYPPINMSMLAQRCKSYVEEYLNA